MCAAEFPSRNAEKLRKLNIKADARFEKRKKSVSMVWCGARLNLHTITLSAAAAQNKWSRVHLHFQTNLKVADEIHYFVAKHFFSQKNETFN